MLILFNALINMALSNSRAVISMYRTENIIFRQNIYYSPFFLFLLFIAPMTFFKVHHKFPPPHISSCTLVAFVRFLARVH